MEVDYTFVRSGQPSDEMATVLLAYHKGSGYGLARVVSCKGAGDASVVPFFLTWLAEVGLMGSLRLRGDSEPSLQALLRAVASKRQGMTVVESTPVGSSSSLGGAERFADTICVQRRAHTPSLGLAWPILSLVHT
mgnify:CR=1 FL=1